MISTRGPRRNHNRTTALGGLCQRPRRGITLIEVLLAGILSATLMIGLWNLFTTYSRLFETGEAKTQRAQLVRALMQRLREDLVNANSGDSPLSPAARSDSLPASGTSAMTGPGLIPASRVVESALTTTSFFKRERSGPDSDQLALESATDRPQFGLWGTSQALQLDVLQPVPESVASLPPAEADGTGTFRSGSPFGSFGDVRRAPEFRSIVYRFFEPGSRALGDRESPAGLLRYELDWESAWAAVEESSGRTVESILLRALPESDLERSERADAEAGVSNVAADGGLSGESVVWAPEIVWLEFRYFDGHSWHSEWDSRQRQALPSAVEVTFILERTKRHRPADASHPGETEADAPNETGAGFPQTLIRLSEISPEEIHRQLICLPAAPARRPLFSGPVAGLAEPVDQPGDVLSLAP